MQMGRTGPLASDQSEPKMAADAKLEKVSLWEWQLLLMERAMIVT
jgi:hypothetical protein